MICPWCREQGKQDQVFFSFIDAEAHLREHGATDDQIEQARRAWQNEMISLRDLQRQEWEATR